MKRIVIIGATSGIGYEVAKIYRQLGWRVGVAGRRIERLEAFKEQDPEQTEIQQLDVTEVDAVEKFHLLIDKLGGMDLFLLSTGIGSQNRALNTDIELATVNTNAIGFTRMVTAAYHYFKEQGAGHLAVISSIAGTKGLGASPAYSATKRFQNHYLECLSQQARMRHLPIAITDIRPGFVKTDLIAGSSYPLQLKPEDVAKHIVSAIENGKEVKVIDWRYDILVFLWRLIPRWLWTRLRITT